MREIKFRAWDGTDNIYFLPPEIIGLDGDFSEVIKRTGWLFEQFTGLLDKNGVEIYEGDVVYFFEKNKFEIEFEEDSCCFGLRNMSDDRFFSLSLCGVHASTIVGNIHDNPELLEATQ